jgi:methylated-DNA-[protein]-cysteine S-methyltransferase
MTQRRVVDTPLGPILLGADTSGRLTELRIGGVGGGGIGGVPGDLEPVGADEHAAPAASHVLDVAATQLDEYFEGRRTSFAVALAMQGSPFQLRVWDQLQTIPYGTTVSYGHLAAQLGRPGAARAVGHANGRNPIPIIVPCHRVIGSTGQLTGYGGGLDAKRMLLGLEAGQSSGRDPSSSVSLTARAVPHRPIAVAAKATTTTAVTTAVLAPSSTHILMTARTKTDRITNA